MDPPERVEPHAPVDYSTWDGLTIDDPSKKADEMDAWTKQLVESNADTSQMDPATREKYLDMKQKATSQYLMKEVSRRRSTWDARKRDVPLCRDKLTVEKWLKYEDWKKPQMDGAADAFRVNQGRERGLPH
jgi:hypothetical protein